MNRKIIRHACIITMNAGMDIITDGNILIEGDEIKEISEHPFHDEQAEITDARGMFVLPGFVNTHTHLPMTMLRGYADDLPLHEWLTEHIFPAEARWVNEKHVRTATLLALVEMIKSGTTCFNDMYFFEDAIAEEAARAGMRGVVGESLIDAPTPSFKHLEEGVTLTEKLIKKWQGDSLIHPGVCAHAPYTCSGETLQKAKQLADKYGTRLHIHLSETRKEMEDLQLRTGKTPTAYLHTIGLLDSNVTAAHCVWLTEEDTELLTNKGTSVAHCPKSNLKLASGIADTHSMHKAGITIGIGTDGTASNNTLDMVEEMRFAALLPKVQHYNPEAADAPTVLRMATIEGARALGLEKTTGSIEKGKKADLIVVNAEASNMIPMYNPYSAIVYAMNSKNIRSTMVAGKWLMKNRLLTTLDKESIEEEMQLLIKGIRR